VIRRQAEIRLRELARQFKAVAVVGPRQSGKTTLVRFVFDNLPYVNLENPDTRRFAIDDPRGFLSQFSEGAIIDEAQRAPEIFSYLQQILDELKDTGKFIITGSNNFLLHENISQSLAGRIAYLNLLPFTGIEIAHIIKTGELNDTLLKGFYPAIYDQPVDPAEWKTNYVRTYIERDVRQVKNITDLHLFDRFLRLCAGRTAQLLNISNLALETGVDNKTIQSWIGILENSFIVFRLQSYHRSFNKRLVKMPKLYFYDTGIACNLLGLHAKDQLMFNSFSGSLFENFIVSDLIKNNLHHGSKNNFYFWRDSMGHEIDLIIEEAGNLHPVEIKSGKTITQDYFKGLTYLQKISGLPGGRIIYAGELNQKRSDGIEVTGWKSILTSDEKLKADPPE